MVPTIFLLPVLTFGLLGYYPHRLAEVETYSDVGRRGQHTCIAYHDDWGSRFCRAGGEALEEGWFTASPPCVAADQARPTWLDATILRPLDGVPRPFVITPFLPDRDLLYENIDDCDWRILQIRTIGGEDPQTGIRHPEHLYFGAYVMGPELPLASLLPAPGSVVTIDRPLFAATIARLEASAGWDALTAAGYTWGQVALTCMVLVFEEPPSASTGFPALLALSLWAHATGEAAAHYGPSLAANLGLPPQVPPHDSRLLSFQAGIEGLYPTDAHVRSLPSRWGTLKSAFGSGGGG